MMLTFIALIGIHMTSISYLQGIFILQELPDHKLWYPQGNKMKLAILIKMIKSLYRYVDVLYWCIHKKEFFTRTVSCSLVPFILIFSYLLGPPILLFACLTADISLLEELDHPFIHLRATMQLSSVYRCQETLLASLLTLFLPFVFHNILQELHFHFSVFRFVAIPVVSSQGICFWKLCRGWLTKHLGSWKGVNL